MTTAIPRAPTIEPTTACDVVMKGGITSGVVYPRALRLLGTHYRFKGLGGASAGAIGAALGAAAEFGRSNGGFDLLDVLPDELVDGKLARLFQPQHRTRKLLDLMLVATSSDRSGPKRQGLAVFLAVVRRTIRSFPVAGLLGAVPGALCVIVGAAGGHGAGVVLIVAGVILMVVGWAVAVLWRLYRLFTIEIPANRFGICSGLSTKAGEPGFTDWLSAKIDAIAGLSESAAPLTFGQLWAGKNGTGDSSNRDIDLRLITTCLTEGTPFEMPVEARRFFFDPGEWRQLFPEYVVNALERAPEPEAEPSDSAVDGAAEPNDPQANDGGSAKKTDWQWEAEQAALRKLRRLPDAEHLPVIVATRMSLSFPLLIAAVPLYTVNRRDARNKDAVNQFRKGDTSAQLYFSRVWFTDGGLCSNFPVYLFDAALPSRPTFAINLGSFSKGVEPDPSDQTKNVEWAKTNRSGILPPHTELPTKGLGAVTAFASAAINTARNWQDNSHLDLPGYRDRIVRVLQSKSEGGMNLRMSTETIKGLAERGETAARVMVDQFNTTHYAHSGTGWDNHRWVRYRALLSVLPDWIASYQRGLAVLQVDPARPPSYGFKTAAQRELAGTIAATLSQLAEEIDQAKVSHPRVVADLTAAPQPLGRLRRIPQI
jgi:predicted acylesterase/phospholipase RssA